MDMPSISRLRIILRIAMPLSIVLCASGEQSNTGGVAPEKAGFCNLVKNPKRYDQKLILTEAVLVKNFQPRVDGGEPFLYSPNCAGSEHMVLWERLEEESDPEVSKQHDKVFSDAEKKSETGRAKAKVIGKFMMAKDSGPGFGHLDGWRLMLNVVKVEKYEPVSSSAVWPRTESKQDK
jgi:hypothetical protein